MAERRCPSHRWLLTVERRYPSRRWLPTVGLRCHSRRWLPTVGLRYLSHRWLPSQFRSVGKMLGGKMRSIFPSAVLASVYLA